MTKIHYDNKNTHSQFYFKDQKDYYDPALAPILVALDLQTPMNIGAMIRLAGNIGCRKLIFTGNQQHFRADKIRRTATSAYGHVDWEFCEHHFWKEKIPDDYHIVAVETTANAASVFDAQLKGKFAFVLGNERFGIDDKSLEMCEGAIYIPMPGIVKSMNVVQAANVVLFEWLRANLRNQ